MIYNLKDINNINITGRVNDKWVPVRPMNFKYRTLKERIIEAYKVFIGKVDAFIWPEDQ